MLQLSDFGIPGFGRRYTVSDAVLGFLVLTVVGVMLVPLPPWLLDILMSLNLAGSLIVLLLSLHAGDTMKLTALPSLLLLATLVRLSLGIAATRLILLDASAGEVIAAFGQIVVRGNYVVGAVVFAILVVVQFVVIAKGSERVAEVAARFSLDAMPGRQLAIDGELRGGAIDGREAGRQRLALQREGQFYGAMDGAMRFVRGDVIASLLITVVTLFGGLGIGVFSRDMHFVDALRRYALLSIGSGLVTLLPALLLATAAGVLVTRVAGDEPNRTLGQELERQLFRSPGALTAAGALLGVLALVPGLPALPFLIVGGLLVAASWLRTTRPSAGRSSALDTNDQTDGSPVPRRFVPEVSPWSIEVGPALAYLVCDERRGHAVPKPCLETVVAMLRDSLFGSLGVPLPEAVARVSSALEPRGVVLSCHEIPELRFEVPISVAELDVAKFILAKLLPSLERRAADFLGIPETQRLLDELEQRAPALVRAVVPKPVSVPLLTAVLKRLLDEGVSVRDLSGVLETLATTATKGTEPPRLVESVRAHRRRTFTHELTGGKGWLGVYLLDPSLEDVVRGAIRRTDAEGRLALAPAAARDIVAAVKATILDNGESAPVLLTEPDIRYPVRQLLQTELPTLRVVSHTELTAETAIRPLGTARIGA